jgi:hypothetical protein
VSDCNWVDIACDSSCTNILAISTNNGNWVSNNGGMSFSQIVFDGTNVPPNGQLFTPLAVSETGQFMAFMNNAKANFWDMFLSSDYGASFVMSTTAPNAQYWESIAMSADGQQIIGSYDYSTLMIGTNNVTATPSSAPTASISTVSPSIAPSVELTSSPSLTPTTNPTTTVPTTFQPTTASPTIDYNLLWYTSTAPSLAYLAVTSSSSGQYLIATTDKAGIQYSLDFGNTWNASTSPSTFDLSAYEIYAVTSSCSGLSCLLSCFVRRCFNHFYSF